MRNETKKYVNSLANNSCVKMPISYSKVVDCADAQSAYSKFDPYLFDVKHEYGHGKNKAFEG